MERKNQEPVTQLDIEQALWQISEGEMLQFVDNGVRLLKYVETRENQSRQMRTGETIHTYTLPIREPVIVGEFIDLTELVAARAPDSHQDETIADAEASAELQDWFDSLVSPEDVIEASYKSLINNEASEDDKAKYPSLRLINEVTGEERDIDLDLAALLVNGDVEIELISHDRTYSDNLRVVERGLKFKVSDHIDQLMSEIGIDSRSAIKTSGSHVDRIELERSDIVGFRAYWQKRVGQVTTSHKLGNDSMTAYDVLEAGQARVNKAFCQAGADDEAVLNQEWFLKPLRPLKNILEELEATIAGAGYTLGYTQSDTLSGETGPSFFVLNKSGNIILQLSSDDRIRESLEKAASKLKSLRK